MKIFLLSVRYWLIEKLVGDMAVIANCNIEEELLSVNIDKERDMPYMVFGNKITPEKYVYAEEKVDQGDWAKGQVKRKGNMFVLEP